MKNVAYLRVSTEAQTEKFGLDMQKQKILDYCEKRGEVIERWYIDGGYSGSNLQRPKIQDLLDDAERGLFQTVFIYKLDRMSRDVIDTLNLLYRVLPKYNVQVVSMTEDIKTENPMDKVMIGVNAIMGQYEREVIYMRTRAGMLERVKRGLWIGGGNLPYGYSYDRNDGLLHPNEKAEDIPKIFNLYLKGYSCDTIGDMLGIGHSTVRAVLKHKVFIGLIEYKGNIYQGKHEPLIDKDTFYKVQDMLSVRTNNSYVFNKYLLTGLCYCGVCGARMRYHKWGGKPKIVCYSHFKGKDYMARDRNCDNKKIGADKVEDLLETQFKKFRIHVSNKPKEIVSNIGIIKDSIQKSNNKIKKLYSLYVENDSEQLLDVIHEEEEHVKQLKIQLTNEEKEVRNTSQEVITEINKVCDVWDTMTDTEKNKILKKCIEKVVIAYGKVEVFFKF